MIKSQEFILPGGKSKTIYGDLTFDETMENLPTIIFVHGFKGFKDWGAHHLVAEYFAKAGYRFIKFNLSHSGVTANHPTEVTDMDAFANNTITIELKDLDTVINYAAHTFPNQPIYLIGHSRGGGLVILKGADDIRIKKIITWSAIAGFDSLWKKEQEAEWMQEGLIYVENARTKEKMPLSKKLLQDYNAHKSEYDIIDAATRVPVSWLIIQGEADVNVKPEIADQLLKAQPNAMLKYIEDANHVYGVSHPYTHDELPVQLKEVC